MPRIDIRVSDELAEEIQNAAAERGSGNLSAFIRQAIIHELRYVDSALRETEERLLAGQENLRKELRRLQTVQQVQYALLDCFVRLFLVCIPEPSGEAIVPLKARAVSRCDNLLKNVARNMAGDVRAILERYLDPEQQQRC
jgi:predicted DNA-binding protein